MQQRQQHIWTAADCLQCLPCPAPPPPPPRLQVRKTMDAASHPALLLVDGVSSIGALDFQVGAALGLGWDRPGAGLG